MPSLELEGVTLHYEEVGQGPTLLVLHGGLGLDHTYFRPDFDRLSDHGRVVYLDQRGQGRSTRTDEALSIAGLAADAAGVIEALGAPATVIGHSFGGFVAQELAVERPDLLARLVLLGTTPGQFGERDDRDADQGPPPPADLLSIFAESPSSDDDFRDQIRRLTPFYMHGDDAVLKARMDRARFDHRASEEGFASLSEWSSVDRLDRVVVPTLLAVGEHDQFTSRPQSERIARQIPHAELAVFPNSGHFPWLEEPDAFWDVVDRFLRT